MKVRLIFGLVLAGASSAWAQSTPREAQVLKKIRVQYSGIDAAILKLDQNGILGFYDKKCKVLDAKGKPLDIIDAVIAITTQFQLRKSLTAKTSPKTITVTGNSAKVRAVVNMTAVLPQRGYPNASSTVKVRSVTDDFWSYSKAGWKISKVVTVEDFMWINGKLTSHAVAGKGELLGKNGKPKK